MSNKSVTVKIGADTKDFLSKMQKADKEVAKTQKTADNLSKSLQFEFSDTKFTSAQKQYQKALEQTEQNAEALRQKLQELEKGGRIDSADYSELQLQLAKTESKATDLKQKLEQLNDVKLEQLTAKFTNAGEKMTALGNKMRGVSLGATGILAGGAAIAKSAASAGAEIDDLSQRFDVSAETIQRWQYLAMQGGVDVDVFTKALVKMRAAVADVAAGTSNKATETLFALGLDPAQFSSQEEMFNAITQALAGMEDKTLQAAYANELFGDKIATEMLQYLNTGADELAKWNAEFDAMPSLTGEQASALAELDDEFNRLNTSLKYAGAELGLAFAPIMEKVVGWIEEYFIPAIEKLADGFSGLPDGTQNFIVGMLGLLALGAPILTLFGKFTSGIGGLVKGLMSLNKAQLITTAGFAAMTGAAFLAFDLIGNWKKLSFVEKLLKGLGVAALAAAAAMMVFHTTWSLGLAIGAITAGIVAGIAMIKSVSKDIYPEEDSSGGDAPISTPSYNYDNYTVPEYSGAGGNTYHESSSNDTYNVTIVIEGTELSKEEIAEEVSRKIATLAQSRG